MELPQQLRPDQIKQLHEALVDAFRERPDLEMMVLFHLEIGLESIADAVNLSACAFQVIRWAESRGITAALIQGAVRERPTNPKLRAFVNSLEYRVGNDGSLSPTPSAGRPSEHSNTTLPIGPHATVALPSVPGPVAPFDPQRAHFFVPFRAKAEGVIGREEALRKVREQLLRGRPTSIGQAAAFVGLGGLGKTQLAVEYAHTYRESYAGGVYWFTADGDLDAQLARLARDARWVSPESEPRIQLELAIHQIRTRSDCLIVFDNVELLDRIRPLLPEPTATPHLLVTSRFSHSGFDPVPLDRLTEEQALRMLASESRRTLDRTEDQEAALRIAQQLEGLPLALELVGAYLRQTPSARWSEYADQLEAKGIQVQALRTSLGLDSFTRHEAGLRATLHLSDQAFEKTPLLREVLDLMAWSGPSPMGRSLLTAMLGCDAAELMTALDVGESLRILTREEQGVEGAAEPRYEMHRLVREVRRLDVPFDEQRDRWRVVPQRVGDWFEKRRDDFHELARFEAEIDHLETWEAHAQTLDFARDAARLLWLRAYPPYHRGRYSQSRDFVLHALKMYVKGRIQDAILHANLLHDVGTTSWFLGEHRKALEYEQKALEIRREVLGGRHPDTATSLNGVGNSFGALGENYKALEYKQQALTIRREVLGERHPATATSLNNVGSSFRALGEHRKALEYMQQALEIRREVQGERHPDTATAINNVGGSFSNLGEHRKALEYTQQALKIRREVQGERHPYTATSLGNVGGSFSNLGEHRTALKYAQQALAILREVLGERHPDTATAFGNVGISFGALGEYRKALEYAQQALEILREVMGERHPDTATALNNVGNSFSDLGHHRNALEYMQQALEIRRVTLGERHPHTLSSRRNVAGIMLNLGKRVPAFHLVNEGLKHAPNNRELQTFRAQLGGGHSGGKQQGKRKGR